MKKEHLAHFSIAGFTYYDGVEAFESLRVGIELSLRLDSENKYDPRAIAIYFEDFKLGYVPRSENRIFYKLLMVELSKNIKLRVQRIAPNENPENQIQVVAHLIQLY